MRPWVILMFCIMAVSLEVASCAVPPVDVGYEVDRVPDSVRRRTSD